MEKIPYDSVFRTMLNDCSSLIIPLLNEAFGEDYIGDEEIVFRMNEHFMNRQDGRTDERITDTCFQVIKGSAVKKYHWECQSTGDNSLLIRIFEYDSQIALDDGEMRNGCLEVTFPHSAVLYLRSAENMPDSMTIWINTPGGRISYDVPVVKTGSYTLEEIFEKKLYFLIPYYIFRYEGMIKKPDSYEEYEDKIILEYGCIRDKLNKLMLCGVIDEYTKCMITDMTVKVIRNLAAGNENIKRKVGGIMVGEVLDYEAKRILKSGIEQGIEQGIISFVKLAMKYGEKKEKAVEDAAIEFGVTKQHILNVLDKNNYQGLNTRQQN